MPSRHSFFETLLLNSWFLLALASFIIDVLVLPGPNIMAHVPWRKRQSKRATARVHVRRVEADKPKGLTSNTIDPLP